MVHFRWECGYSGGRCTEMANIKVILLKASQLRVPGNSSKPSGCKIIRAIIHLVQRETTLVVLL